MYAPTNEADDKTKNLFHEELLSQCDKIPRPDLILGDVYNNGNGNVNTSNGTCYE